MPGHCLVRACLLGYTQAYVQIMQHTHVHKAVTGKVEAKKLLSRRRQSNYSNIFFFFDEMTGKDDPTISYSHLMAELSILAGWEKNSLREWYCPPPLVDKGLDMKCIVLTF